MEQKQLATIERLQQDLQKAQKINDDLNTLVDELRQKIAKDNHDSAERFNEVEHKCNDLQQKCQDQQKELSQRLDIETRLQYHKGLCESLRQISDKAKQETTAVGDRLRQATEENARLIKQHQEVSQELRDLRMQVRSEQSFLEKEQKITELQTDLQRIKRDESLRRQKMAGENDSLRTKNLNMQQELRDLRGRMQKGRQTSRRSMHDESRTMDENDMVEQPSEKATECANCTELSAKEKKLNGDIYIKDCHIARLKMMLDNNSILRENEELREEAKKHVVEHDQWQQEICKLKSALAAVKSIPPACPVPCPKCARQKHLKDFGQQTEPAPAYNGSAIITETDNNLLQQQLHTLSRKYQMTKQLCRDRQQQIDEMKRQVAGMAKASNNGNVASDPMNGDCKENAPLNKVSGDADLKRFQVCLLSFKCHCSLF